jgi:hypothetical protein
VVITAVAAVAFIAAPILLVFVDALGFARQDFRAEFPVLGLFIAAALLLLGVRAAEKFLGK